MGGARSQRQDVLREPQGWVAAPGGLRESRCRSALSLARGRTASERCRQPWQTPVRAPSSPCPGQGSPCL